MFARKKIDIQTLNTWPRVTMFSEKFKFILLFIYISINLHSLACDIDSVKIVYYYGPTYSDHRTYDLDKVAAILQHPKFTHKRTNVYMHGYNGSQETSSVRLIVDSYYLRNYTNLLTIDWRQQASGSYPSAQQCVLGLVPKVSEAFLRLFAAGLDSDTVNLVGHSMGGHAVGLIGREIFNKSNGGILLPRITALDPSNPAANEIFILPLLEKTDAKFVDVIHTDAGGRGIPLHLGHADFWPNGGTAIQPGCPPKDVNYLCSHRKAWAYWALSVANVDQEPFWAFHAQNYDDFLENGASDLNEKVVLMGINCPYSARGDYYIQIDSDYGGAPIIGIDS